MTTSSKRTATSRGGFSPRRVLKTTVALGAVAGFVGLAAVAPFAAKPAEAKEYPPLARGSVMNQQLMAAATAASDFDLQRFEAEPPPPPPKPKPSPTPTATPTQDADGDQGTADAGAKEAETPAPPAPPAATPDPGTAQAIARGYVGSDSEFSCLNSLWERESNWNVSAMNTGSGAYGIPQSLPGDKMASAGADWQTNPDTQIRWGLGYIQGRYGSPCNAWAHSESVGWY